MAKPVLLIGDPQSTISGLTIQMGPGASGGGLALDAGKASSIDVVDAAAMPTTKGTGVVMGPGSALADSRVLLTDPAKAGLAGVQAKTDGGADTTVDRVEIAAYTGLDKRGPGTAVARRLDIHDTIDGAVARGDGGALHLSSSVIRGRAGETTVALAAQVGQGLKPTLMARNVTAIGGGPGSAGAVAAGTAVGDDPHIRLQDTILYGFTTSLRAVGITGGKAEVRTSSSSYDFGAKSALESGSIITSKSDFPGGVTFVDAAKGDYRLRVPSQAIDHGSADDLDPLDSITDLAGNPRVADGDGDGDAIIDMGAYETVGTAGPGAGVAGNVAGGGSVGGGTVVGWAKDSTKPATTRLSRSGTTIRFRLSEPATIRLALARRVKGKRGKTVWRTEKTLTRRGTAGANRIALGKKLRSGSYRVTVTAVDGAGNRSAAKTLAFRAGVSR